MRIALGTVQFGIFYGIANQTGKVPYSEVNSILNIASFMGVDTLDTAIGYGESEACLGRIGVSNFKVVTKLPPIPVDCIDLKSWIRAEVFASMDKLRVNKLHGLLLHKPDQLLSENCKDLYKELISLKEENLVSKIGISVYSPIELDLLIPKFHFDIVQVPFNILDKRMYSSGWLNRLKNKGIEVHARSIFLQGLLLLPRGDMPLKFSVWNDIWDIWYNWLEAHKHSALKLCLDFVLSFSQIDRIIVGVDNTYHFQQIMDSINSPPLSNFPSIHSDDVCLINPAKWQSL